MQVTAKVIVVTGGGSGIGRELVIQLVKKGARVAIADVNEAGMAKTVELAGKGDVSTHVLNIADRAAVEAFPAKVIAAHGAVDAIINNAGIIQPFTDVNDLDYEHIERVMNINFYGTLYMCKSFLPHLLKRPEAHIANVSSMGGFIPFPGQTFYGASKAAVKLLTEGLYAELKDTQVGVTVIHPGAVNTDITSNSGVQSPQFEASQKNDEVSKMAMPADEAAKVMVRAIEKNKYRVMVGKDAQMLDFFYRLAPQRAVNLIVKRMGAFSGK
ncbi:MAG TPA: short-chain dehydrogenase [Cryomorphaceae bacterium]|nr:short-chain dehydrogenase [Owenweeksia sp.]MBG00322.1 short-chain dehydrogenase [Owenweeksia sp.]HAD98440.1 short-chain dehydrogenase [Cryomorphaceae bacterium]HBF19374.1 short-chain dehydrogenase [Cryomorphaceae bacterium]|tara:strand:+ start:6844 stop:7653 length:810 start_codon:yes stop_codon:yes gene_type:complete